ncbi:MAG: proteasome lid subunit RPN8/RPN11 [Nitrospinales bacterium]|jgi:proteasome lid subunit RPN8/RPN11
MSPLEKEQLDEIHRHAVEEYPHECCGIVVGDPDHNNDNVVHRCENIQNKLHEKDPENFTRDARTAYNISALELQKILSAAGSKGRVFKVLYHSHPEHDAYFSEEDTRMALFDGESPIYPGTQYLVVSVYDKKVRDQELFGWDPETKTFERNPL